jgi:hypothetical protein
MNRSTNIAMWSGPRNLSTAMMRSFENRADCAVWDEPFYIPYLLDSGVDHPLRDAVLESGGERDWRAVIQQCLAPAPDGASIFYQKHITHHMTPRFDRDWIAQLTNVFLIRAPKRVVASYARKRERATLHDIGFVEQKELFDLVCDQNGAAPVVVDSADIQSQPDIMIPALCTAIDIPFDANMLRWPAGRRDSDGVLGAHWYNAVIESTGFDAPPNAVPALDDDGKRLADAAQPYYDALRGFALTPG